MSQPASSPLLPSSLLMYCPSSPSYQAPPTTRPSFFTPRRGYTLTCHHSFLASLSSKLRQELFTHGALLSRTRQHFVATKLLVLPFSGHFGPFLLVGRNFFSRIPHSFHSHYSPETVQCSGRGRAGGAWINFSGQEFQCLAPIVDAALFDDTGGCAAAGLSLAVKVLQERKPSNSICWYFHVSHGPPDL